MTLRWCCGPCNTKGLRSATPPIGTTFSTDGEEMSRKRRRIGSAECSNDRLQENKLGGEQSRQAISGANHHVQVRQEHRQHEPGDKRQERDGPPHQGRGQAAPAVAEPTNRQQIVGRAQERPSHIEAETRDMGELLKTFQEIYRRNSDERTEEKRRLEGAIEKRDRTIEELKQTVQQRDQAIQELNKVVGEREDLVLSLESRNLLREKECRELQVEEKKLRQTCKDLRDKLSKAKQFQKEDDEKVEEEEERVRKELERLQERRKRQIFVFDFDESGF